MSVSLIHQIFTFKNIFPTRMNISSSENLNVLKHLISRHFILNSPKCVSFTVFSSGWDTYILYTCYFLVGGSCRSDVFRMRQKLKIDLKPHGVPKDARAWLRVV